MGGEDEGLIPSGSNHVQAGPEEFEEEKGACQRCSDGVSAWWNEWADKFAWARDNPAEFRDQAWAYLKNPRNYLILILVLMVIFFGTTNRVMFKKMLIPMVNYPFFLNQMTSFVYLPVFWPVVYFMMFFTDKITPEMRNFAWYKFTVMGLLDATAGLLMTFGGTHVSGPMQLLLSQGAIPFSMFFSVIVSMERLAFIFRRVLSVNYAWNHYIGAAVIIVGIFVSLFGQLFLDDGDTDSQGTSTSLTGVIIYESANIPLAFSGVYKEIAFKGEARLDVFYVNAWVATWQFFLGMLFLPVNTLPGFGGLGFDEIPGNLWNGAKCLVGIDSITTGDQPDHCEGAWMMVGGYLIANIFYNIVLLFMIKYGSAALFYVCSAVILPTADICFTFNFIMGDDASSLSAFDVSGLITILIGLILYRLMPESGKKKPPDKEEDETAGKVLSEEEDEVVPIIMPGGTEVSTLAIRRPNAPLISRSVTNIRHHYMSRLGIHDMPRKVAQDSAVE